MGAPSPRRRLAPSRLPSKKILPIIVLCVVVVGIITITAFYNPRANPQSQSASLAIVNAANANGLAQAVYQKIQTELTALATSSADSNSSATSTTATNAVSTPPLTATEALSQEFITEYLAVKQSGQTMTPDQESSFIPNLIQNGNISNYIPQPKVFTPSDIIVTNNTSAAALRTYGDAIAAVLIKNRVPSGLNELDILQTAVNSGNQSNLANLAIITASYNDIVTELAKVSTPPEAVSLHLALLNDFGQALTNVQGMQKLFTDPVVTVAAIQNYETNAPAIYNDLSAFGPLFAKSGVTFDAAEPGAIFLSTQ